MIVIGDHQSSNTRHLTELCQQQCSQVCWIEQADELSADRFAGASCVGITAGASTPGWIIKEVKTKMSNEVKMEIEESFAELLEASIKTLNTGDKVIGTVVQITPTDIQVDLGTKHAGYIAMNEFSDDPAVKAEEILKARSVVGEVYLDEKIEQYIADIVFATRYPDRYGLKDLKDMISFGGSPRASINLAKAARAYAFIKRRGYVVPEDVRAVAHDVLRHRIGLTYEAEAANITSEEIVSKIINKVEVP